MIDSGGDFVDGLLFDFGTTNAWASLNFSFSSVSNTRTNPRLDVWSVWVGDTFDAANASSPLESLLISAGAATSSLSINPSGHRYVFVAAQDGYRDVASSTVSVGPAVSSFRASSLQAVPEPGSLALLGLGLAGLGLVRRRKA